MHSQLNYITIYWTTKKIEFSALTKKRRTIERKKSKNECRK
jgi:hypothetical protein